jgi:hypothetical protein
LPAADFTFCPFPSGNQQDRAATNDHQERSCSARRLHSITSSARASRIRLGAPLSGDFTFVRWRPDWLAEVVRLELRNPSAGYVFEMS